MSKKFVVETDYDKMTEKNLRDVLFGRCQYGNTDYTVTELKPPPEVKRVETGVLMDLKEITGRDDVVKVSWLLKGKEYSTDIRTDNLYIGKRIELNKLPHFPRKYFKDIETTLDFDSIPVGSLVECSMDGDKKPYYGVFERSDLLTIVISQWNLNKRDIKSIRIVELAKEGVNEVSM